MRVFITGISEYLGSFLAEYLSGFPEVETITGISRTSSPIPLTIFRPSFIIGPHERTYIPGVRQNPIWYPGA
jgi:nucleoside-diphosphate-sugar epimerase